MSTGRAPFWPGTLIVILVTAVWGILRLWIFREQQLPLTFVLPLLLCVWTRQRWHLVGMAVTFVVMATVKHFWILPDAEQFEEGALAVYFTTLFNIVFGAGVVAGIMRLRDVLDARAESIQRQNAELDAQAEELAQQNEEIRTQGEELAQQNEEIEAQSEELQRQNEELLDTNQRLRSREDILQTIVDGTRSAEGGPVLDRVCQRSLANIGAPADVLGLAEVRDDTFVLRSLIAIDGRMAEAPGSWSRAGSFVGLVLDQDRTAYVDDLEHRPDLATPFAGVIGLRSVLGTPVVANGHATAVLFVGSRSPAHWTQDQFRLLEWSAAQCGLILEGQRWQTALQERTDAVEAANRAKDSFLAMLSHELRTPLGPVLVAIDELLLDGRIPADLREQLDMVRRNVSVQSRLIDDLLDLTRIARGKIDLNQQPVSVQTLLRETAAIVAVDLAAKEQTLALDVELPVECHVLGDAARLQQVFWNLLKNSTKFSPRGAVIRMRARLVSATLAPGGAATDDPRHRRVVIDVVDTGAGIAADDLQRIFQPFEQVAAQRASDQPGGLGLGLSIARAITELHDGTIQVRSAGLGTGATFTVELPLALSTETTSIAALPRGAECHAGLVDGSMPPPMVARKDRRILLVEDHMDTGLAMRRMLQRAGFEVELANSVQDGFARWSASRFDLLISDIGLADGSGIDLLTRIRDASGDVAAICMSGYGMESDLAQSSAAGFRDHLIKPVPRQKLLDAISRAFASRSTAESGS